MTDIDTHALNLVMAKVAGVAIVEYVHIITREKSWNLLGHDLVKWNPIEDHNQMSLVEAALLKQGYYICVDQFPVGGSSAFIYRFDGKDNLPEHSKIVTSESKLIALALAVKAMVDAKGG